MNDAEDGAARRDVLDFWFPEGRSPLIDAGTHKQHWFWRMRGGAHDQVIARFSGLTAQAAARDLHHWSADAEGRLALIILLDQFSRSVWAGSARAFAQDPAALALALEGLENGHFDALPVPWFRIVHTLPLGHCEGPDHLARMDRLIALRTQIAAAAPAQLQPIYRGLVEQARDVRRVIAAFGRHPHRNGVLGRPSTPAEEDYLAKGDFPHQRAFEGE